MFSARKIIVGAALGCALAATPAAAGVVVKSSGPSASSYPVGKKLDDAGSVTLREGDSLTVLTGTGTRVLRGPGTHRIGARGKSKRTAFAMLTRQRSGARVRTGAVRGGSGSDAAPVNPNLWNVDVGKAATMCVPAGEAVGFWRADKSGAETYVLGSAASDFHVHVTFGEGDATTSLEAEELPLAQGLSYDLAGPGGRASQRIDFVVLDSVPEDPEGLAVALAENGCTSQLDLLSDRLAD